MAEKLNQQDKILFKHYSYKGGSEYCGIIAAMDEYTELKTKPLRKKIADLQERIKTLTNENTPK